MPNPEKYEPRTEEEIKAIEDSHEAGRKKGYNEESKDRKAAKHLTDEQAKMSKDREKWYDAGFNTGRDKRLTHGENFDPSKEPDLDNVSKEINENIRAGRSKGYREESENLKAIKHLTGEQMRRNAERGIMYDDGKSIGKRNRKAEDAEQDKE